MFILASIFISFALAADKPTCSIRSVTRNCEFFKERKDQEVIKLSDGTFYKNPAAKPATEGMTFGGGSSIPPMGTGFFGMGMAMDGSAYREFVEKDLRTQSEVLDALEGAGLSTEFRLAFSQRAAFMDSQPDQKISLPWPPNEKGAQTNEVTGEEVSTLL